MLFIETSIFTQLAAELLDDESLRTLQNLLLEKPERGPVIAVRAGCGSYASHYPVAASVAERG